MSFPTLGDLKRAEAARMGAAVDTLSRDLAAFARREGGRFILFGSAARGEMRYDSDVDVLVDFPDGRGWDAAAFARERAADLGLVPDVHLLGLSGTSLRARVEREGRVLA